MPDLETMTYEELKELALSLNAERDALTEKNKKLRKDCVSFAKKIKSIEDSGILNVDVEAIQKENRALRRELSALKEQLNGTDSKPVDEPTEELPPISNTVDNTPSSSYFEQVEDEEPEDLPVPQKSEEEPFFEEDEPEEKPIKHPKFCAIARKVCAVLLALVLVFGVISTVFGLFAHKWTDASLGGYRFASVAQEYKGGALALDDVVVVKNTGIQSAKVNDVILSKVNSGKIFGKVTAITYEGKDTILEVENDKNSYKVEEKAYAGIAKYSIDGLGNLVRYASVHTYNFYGFQLAALLLLLGLLLLIPNAKKKLKYGTDFTEDDYTI